MTEVEMQELLDSEFLRVPNIILQMQRVLKNGNTYACLQFIWCKTGGWGRTSDTIAYSQFINDKRYGTGLGEKTVRRSVEKLANLGVITMSPSFNNMHEFTLNIERICELVGDEAWSKRPPLENASMVNLSGSVVNLTGSMVNLSAKHGQNDLHTRTITQELLHKNSTLDKNSEPKKPKAKNSETPKAKNKVEKPTDVSNQVWSDFLELRKTKKAPLSVTAWNQAKKQVDQAMDKTGHSLEQVMTEWVLAGWTGFKCEWYLNRVGAKPQINRETDKLAVNNQWRQGESNIVEANTSIEDMFGGA